MTKKTAKEIVVEFFKRKGTIPGQTETDRLACDYILAGLVDSFGVVELISELEGTFGIRFDYSDFENPQFKIIGGLIEIVDRRISEVA
jgi:acyl carrier protein